MTRHFMPCLNCPVPAFASLQRVQIIRVGKYAFVPIVIKGICAYNRIVILKSFLPENCDGQAENFSGFHANGIGVSLPKTVVACLDFVRLCPWGRLGLQQHEQFGRQLCEQLCEQLREQRPRQLRLSRGGVWGWLLKIGFCR